MASSSVAPGLPLGWRTVTLKDLVRPERWITYGIVQPGSHDDQGVFLVRGKDYIKGWALPDELFRVSPEIEAAYKRARLQSGDVIMSIVGDVGIAAVVPEWLDGANITQTTARIACNETIALNKFVFYFLSSSLGTANVRKYVKGSAQPGLNLADVEKFQLLLPPLLEQKKIAAILGSVDDAIQATQAVIDQTRKVKQGLLQQLLARGIGHTRFKQTEIGEIPESWDLCTLGAITDPDRPISYGVLKPGDYCPTGVPMLRITDIRSGRIVLNQVHKISSDLSCQYVRTLLSGNETLISLVGTIGLVAHVPGDLAGCNVHRNLGVIVPGKRVDGLFLSLVMGSFVVQDQIRKLTKGGNQPLLNLGDLRQVLVPVPERSEQMHLARELSHLLDIELFNIQALYTLEQVKTRLMNDLLSGRTRVEVSA